MFFWEWFLVLEPFIIHSVIGMDGIHRSHEFLGRSEIHGTWMEVRSCMYWWLWKWVEWVGTSEPARSVMECHSTSVSFRLVVSVAAVRGCYGIS